METHTDLLVLRDKLWRQVRGLPGVVTVGVGSKNDRTALIIFIDEKRVYKEDLPAEYDNVPVILESAGQARAHGG